MEIATLNKQKTVVRSGWKQYYLQCKQPHVLAVRPKLYQKYRFFDNFYANFFPT